MNKLDTTHPNLKSKIFLNGIAAVVALLVLYTVAILLPAGWYVYQSDFAGIIVTGLLALVISTIWLSLYWYMDRLQREPLQAILLAFFCSGAIYAAAIMLYGWVSGSSALSPSSFLEEAISDSILPSCVFYLIFVFYTVHLKNFDEMVDSFIYGACSGIGIACARCMAEFVQYESVSVLFLIIELITRISVYAAICSLFGWILHRTLLSHKNILALIGAVCIILLFGIESAIERALTAGINSSSVKIFPVLVSLGFVALIVGIVAILIHKTISKEAESIENQTTTTIFSVQSPFWLTAVIVCILILPAFIVRYENLKTNSFSYNGWSFSLPVDFVETKDESFDDIFNEPNQNINTFYESKNGDRQIRIFVSGFSSALSSFKNTTAFSPQNGWTITEERNQHTSGARAEYQYMYVLEKGEQTVFLDVFTDSKADECVSRAVRIFAKTLKEAE